MLEVKGLSKYFGGLKAVNNVNLHVKKGEIMSIIGPNGAGKTTFFNLVTGFLQPTRGRVFYKGEDITYLKPYEIANKGVVRTFQKTKIFPDLTVAQAVMVGFHQHLKSGFLQILINSVGVRKEEKEFREKAVEIVKFVGLDKRENTLAKNLSYGEQRLLEIAVALGANPELFLLDEPTAGMNPYESRKVIDLIYRIRDRGTTIILIEHDMNVVMGISERIVVFNHGEKIAEGSPAQIRQNKEVIKAYLGESYYA